jgi:hypothetical protein
MLTLLKRLVCSRVGWLLAIVQLAIIVYWFSRGVAATSFDYLGAETVYTGRFIGNRFVELDSSLSMALVLINAIPVAMAQLLSKVVLFVVPSLTVPVLSWVHALELVFLTTVQWLIVGAFIERMIVLVRDAWFPGTASNKSLHASRDSVFRMKRL